MQTPFSHAPATLGDVQFPVVEPVDGQLPVIEASQSENSQASPISARYVNYLRYSTCPQNSLRRVQRFFTVVTDVFNSDENNGPFLV
jgi:hypothetical protein